MTSVAIRFFTGMKPAINQRLLQDTEAQTAKNVKLNNGALRAMNNISKVKDLTLAVQSTISTIYRYQRIQDAASDTNYWFEFADDADVFLAPVVQDQYKRIYWSTSTSSYPKYGPESSVLGTAPLPSVGYTLGVPKPSATPVATGTAAVSYTKEKRQYIVVFTGTIDSAPSEVTVVNAVDTFQVKLTNIPVPDTTASYTGKKLYRRDANVAGSSYKLVATLSTSDTEYTDTVAASALGATYTIPTASTIAIPDGILVNAATLTSTAAAITRYYAYTVGGYDDISGDYAVRIIEGGMSATASISADETQKVTLNGLSRATATAASYFRIYRKDSANGEFVMIAQIPTVLNGSAVTSYEDADATATGTPYSGAGGTNPTAPTLSASTSTSVNAATAPGHVYCATYLNSAGTESYRCVESNIVRVVDTGTKTTTYVYLPIAPVGVTKCRIYRRSVTVNSNGTTTGAETDYRLLAELPAGQVTYTDTTLTSAISATVLSASLQGYHVVPESGMVAAATVPDDVVPETRVYVFTYVTAYGEEGPPSTSSASVDIDPDKQVALTGLGTGPGATQQVEGVATSVSYNMAYKRLYRSSIGNSTSAFQAVPVTWSGNSTPTIDIPIATTSVFDNAKQDDLGEVLNTDGWIAAGTDTGTTTGTSCHPNLKGLNLSANGIAAGFIGKTVHFSEAYMPHAFPAEYSQTTEYDIVGLASFGQSFAVLTKANPYIATGNDPASMSMTKIELPQGCVSKRSICAMSGGVLYAAPDGLVMLTNGDAKILTKGILSREQWIAYGPSSMLVKQYNDKIYVFHSTGLIVFDFSGESATMTTFDQTTNAAFYDPIQDNLYLGIRGAGATQGIQKWDAGSAMTYTWKSKIFTLPKPTNFSFGQVEASSYGTPYTSTAAAATGSVNNAGNSVLTTTVANANITAGMSVFGVGLGSGVTVVSGATTTSITLSSPLTTAASGTYTFISPTVTFTVYADGVQKLQRPVISRDPFRLPAGFRAKDWEVQLSGTTEIFSVTLAESSFETERA